MKKNILIVGIVTLFVVSAISPIVFGSSNVYYHISKKFNSEQTQLLGGPPLDSPWPMYCHDTRHTGRSPYSTSNTDGVEKWNLQLNGFLWGSPIIDDEGIIYVGSYDFYAIYPNGRIKWQIDDTQGVYSSAGAIDENGILYVGSIWASPNYFYAIDTDNGDIIWKRQNDNIYSSPAIGNDGSIYFGSLNENIYSYYSNGTLKWKYKTNDNVYSSPAIAEDGTVYCGSDDGNLYALYPNNGTLKWKYKTGDWIGRSPSIADDGTIYFGSWDGYLYAVHPDGTLKWKVGGHLSGGATPIIGTDGTIYVGNSGLSAINPDNGTVKWTFNLQAHDIRGSNPCISADGSIYFGTYVSDRIYAINNNGTEKWNKSIRGHIQSAPAIGKDGTVFIGDGEDDGSLHAFGPLDSNAPTAPDINGPRLCIPGIPYQYEFTSTSPLGNKVYYLIEWGDGEVTGWSGTYESGETRTFYHTWELPVKSTIRARAKDTDNLWGPWSELNINKPRTRTFSHHILLERFPLFERLLTLLR
jgi:outer membrane protein assembly factor BamB